MSSQYVVRHSKTLKLLNGELGTHEGELFAKWLQSVDRLDVVDAFYDWCNTAADNERRILRRWVAKNMPDIMTWYQAQKQVLE